MSRINLLPAEVRRARANAARARSITFFGFALAFLLGGLYLIRTWQVVSLRGELDAARVQQAAVRSEIDSYAEIAAGEASIASARGVVSALMAGEISWSEQLLQLAQTVPPGFALSSVSGTTTSGTGGPIVGTLTWIASANGYVTTEAWLVRLAVQEGWTNAWVGNVQGGDQKGLTVSGSVDLTADAITPRGGGPA